MVLTATGRMRVLEKPRKWLKLRKTRLSIFVGANNLATGPTAMAVIQNYRKLYKYRECRFSETAGKEVIYKDSNIIF